MGDLIIGLWEQLRDAGMPEVMLFLPDGTAKLGPTRVALLGDQERNIVRIVPIGACVGIGVASPKGTDPNAYRGVIQGRLASAASPS